MSKNGIYGIDLGTTNSCIALVDPITGKPEMRSKDAASLITPSAVYFERDNPEPVVGREAKRWARISPKLVCLEVKRSGLHLHFQSARGVPFPVALIILNPKREGGNAVQIAR